MYQACGSPDTIRDEEVHKLLSRHKVLCPSRQAGREVIVLGWLWGSAPPCCVVMDNLGPHISHYQWRPSCPELLSGRYCEDE